jgi:hypothetical protein
MDRYEIAQTVIEEARDEVDLRVSIPKKEYEKRWDSVQQAMQDQGIDLASSRPRGRRPSSRGRRAAT